MQTSHISEPISKPPVFIADTGCSIPAGTPPGFAFRSDGLWSLGEGADGRHLFLCPPIEVVGWDGRGRTVVRSGQYPSAGALTAIAPSCRPHEIRRRLAHIGCLPPLNTLRVNRELARYFAAVRQPTGTLWTPAQDAGA